MTNKNTPKNFIDKTGQKFGRLLVRERAPGKNRVRWVCDCDCGGTAVVLSAKLKEVGGTESCGCITSERLRSQNTSHGLNDHPLYTVWCNIIQRCHNPNNSSYRNYGARGIAVCEEWLSDFKVFYDWAISKKWRSGKEVDRRNNDGGYCPENCRIVSRRKNQRNKRNNHLITVFGQTLPLIEAVAKYSDLSYHLVLARLRLGWEPSAALTAPKFTKKIAIIKESNSSEN